MNNHLADWPQAYFTSEADGLAFAPANLVTLRQHYCDRVYDRVFDGISSDNDINDETIRQKAREIMDRGEINVQCFIEVKDGRYTICLDREQVDEAFIEEALDLLMQMKPLQGIHYFGGQKVFRAADIPWITPN